MLWGSNARETHPIFFHHVLQGLKSGTRMYSVDPPVTWLKFRALADGARLASNQLW